MGRESHNVHTVPARLLCVEGTHGRGRVLLIHLIHVRLIQLGGNRRRRRIVWCRPLSHTKNRLTDIWRRSVVLHGGRGRGHHRRRSDVVTPLLARVPPVAHIWRTKVEWVESVGIRREILLWSIPRSGTCEALCLWISGVDLKPRGGRRVLATHLEGCHHRRQSLIARRIACREAGHREIIGGYPLGWLRDVVRICRLQVRDR